MNKKDYVSAVEEIKVTDKQKMEVLRKMNGKKNKFFLKLSLCTACLVAVAVGILVPTKIINNANLNNNSNIQSKILPNVKNYEELYAILKGKQSNGNHFETNSPTINSVIDDSTSSNASSESEKDYSETNVQVEGVDESDVVKTDGEYIYYVVNNSVIIIDTRDANNLKEVYKISFNNNEFYAKEIYIKNDILLIIGQEYKGNDSSAYYDIIYYTDYTTVAKVYNIENKEKVYLTREVKIDGSYLTSRMIGENIYLISNKDTYSICGRYDMDEIKEETLLPKYQDTLVSQEEKCVSYDYIYCMPNSNDSSYLNIASFNISDNKEANIASYLGAGSEVYASTENLYVVTTKFEYSEGIVDRIIGQCNYTMNSSIYKFNFNNGVANYVCDSSVPGSVLNQFSMDENNGYFRIATTNSTSWNSESQTNNMYVLDNNMNVVRKNRRFGKRRENLFSKIYGQ